MISINENTWCNGKLHTSISAMVDVSNAAALNTLADELALVVDDLRARASMIEAQQVAAE
jgi:hypothetical protein